MDNLTVKVEQGVQTLEIRTGQALAVKEPEKIKISGVLDTPFKWLEKRVGTIDQKKAYLTVSREMMSITLVTDEINHYRTTISGELELHPAFVKFGINAGKYRTPVDMAELIKMNRSYFENRQVAMELVSLLRHFKAKIDKEVEAEFNPNRGDKKVFIAQRIDSNIPSSFKLLIPIFKGDETKEVECETYFNPDDLTCTLVSAGANDTIEETKDSAIDGVLEKIRKIAPDIAIMEI